MQKNRQKDSQKVILKRITQKKEEKKKKYGIAIKNDRKHQSVNDYKNNADKAKNGKHEGENGKNSIDSRKDRHWIL